MGENKGYQNNESKKFYEETQKQATAAYLSEAAFDTWTKISLFLSLHQEDDTVAGWNSTPINL